MLSLLWHNDIWQSLHNDIIDINDPYQTFLVAATHLPKSLKPLRTSDVGLKSDFSTSWSWSWSWLWHVIPVLWWVLIVEALPSVKTTPIMWFSPQKQVPGSLLWFEVLNCWTDQGLFYPFFLSRMNHLGVIIMTDLGSELQVPLNTDEVILYLCS